MKILLKSSSDSYVNLAVFTEHDYQLEIHLTINNYFQLTFLPPDFVILCFSPSGFISLLVYHFNTIYISDIHSTWVPWQSAFMFSQEADWEKAKEVSVLNESWASACMFQTVWNITFFLKSSKILRIFPLHINFQLDIFLYGHVEVVVWQKDKCVLL